MKIHVIPLADDGSPQLIGDGALTVLPIPFEPYIIRFVNFAWAPTSHDGILYTNVPPDEKTPFERSKYYAHKSPGTFGKESYIDVLITKGGPYSYYLQYREIAQQYYEYTPESYQEKGLITKTKEYYFIVQSGFQINGQSVNLNALQVQSVMSKLMGPVSTWDSKLGAISNKGYNMVHFTPLQERGESGSPFSIYDQLAWDPYCFPQGESDIASTVAKMESSYGLLSLTDVVLNHTANNSQWLTEHPDAGYSVANTPHLKPALDLDNQLLEFSANIEKYGLPSDVKSIGDLERITASLRKLVIDPIKLWEYYIVDVSGLVDKAMTFLENPELSRDLPEINIPVDCKESLISLATFVLKSAGKNLSVEKFGTERFVRTVDPKFLAIVAKSLEYSHPAVQFRRVLDQINEAYYQEYDDDVSTIIAQLHNRAQFNRLDRNGPQIGPITRERPLGDIYFTRLNVKDESGKEKEVALVNNGWVWAGNPLLDFASAQSKAYLRREVIIWGDCVKLRYGKKPQDSPYLWDHMTRYVQLLAKYFHGFRIDNCHSTPLHVGQYLLDRARLIRPNLYVVAELFTGSEEMDKIFVEKLGLNTVIREAMQAWSVKELSTLVNKNGGRAFGSFSKLPLIRYGTNAEDEENNEYIVTRSSPIHAWFMDCTHDNEFPADKRTVGDTLPNAALVSMCATATGTTMGYDECYPHAPNVVTESKLYSFGGGISEVKKILNDLHFEMGQGGADESYTHLEGQYITVHRIDPITGKGYFLIARTKFTSDGDEHLNDVFLEGSTAKCLFAKTLASVDGAGSNDDKNELHGIPVEVRDLEKPTIDFDKSTSTSIIRSPRDFPQGSIAVFETSLENVNKELDNIIRTGAKEATSKCDLVDLNVLLYKCESEEREYSDGREGVYDLPNYGPLTYAGLDGWITVLKPAVLSNDLGAPICQNLRDGVWAFEYLVNRLQKYRQEFANLVPVIEWFETRISKIRGTASFLRPRFFALLVFELHHECVERFLALIPKAFHRSSIFIQNLALTSVQMVAKSNKVSLAPHKKVASMAAGLPHFSTGFMRCWGRDVFLSTPGLLILLGRYKEAKEHILGFAATLKHGLIPNLLDSGVNPRYNARDAVWFFLQVVQQYCNTVPDGDDILFEKVARRFPLDDTWVPVEDTRAFSISSTLKEIVYEVLARHAASITFREANAGPQLDSQMKDEGFNQHIYVDWENGFVFGGNPWNCGTWMDKMGESERAGNKGFPGTPRDGAAIEITGLLKSTLRWVNDLHRKGSFEWDSVLNQHGEHIKLSHWEFLIEKNFERCYYVPRHPSHDSQYDLDSSIINRRGIYKDLYRSSKPFEDYQLRPNFTIAMCAAPELFALEHACEALAVADRTIRGPVGMATLDPSDWNYRPNYVNSEDSDDFLTAKGRNYHQGPEWLWCTGFFLRALLHFDLKSRYKHGDSETSGIYFALQNVRKRIRGHVTWLVNSPYSGLTELTNQHGAFCADSSPTQAWSSATLLELMGDAFQVLQGAKN